MGIVASFQLGIMNMWPKAIASFQGGLSCVLVISAEFVYRSARADVADSSLELANLFGVFLILVLYRTWIP